MSKIIIHNRSRLTDLEAVARVHAAMKPGKISRSRHGKQHCFLSVFTDETEVKVSKRSRSSETFYVDNHVTSQSAPEAPASGRNGSPA